MRKYTIACLIFIVLTWTLTGCVVIISPQKSQIDVRASQPTSLSGL
jgi:hypothetical protein